MNEKKRKNLGQRIITLIASCMMIYGYFTFLYGRWTGAVLVVIGSLLFLSLGIISWTRERSKMKKHDIIIVMAIVIGVIVAFQASKMFVRSFTPSEKQAIEIGRYFLDGVGRKTGRVLSVQLEEKEPNFYWDYALKFERPDIHGLRSCWVIRFEQAKRPRYWLEVWVDASEHLVIGGDQCR